MAKTLVKLNKELSEAIQAEIIRIGTSELHCFVNDWKVICVMGMLTKCPKDMRRSIQDVISTKVAEHWLKLLRDEKTGHNCAFDISINALEEAQAIYGYGGSATLNPMPDKVVKYS